MACILRFTAYAAGIALSCCAGAPAACAGGPGITTIGFNRLQGGQGSPFTMFITHGYKVASVGQSAWLVDTTYGDPPPFIYFQNAGGDGSIQVTHSGATFTFRSIELYSSLTDIPYTFTGTLNGAQVFTVSGTLPMTYGDFALVKNPDAADIIDTLLITETNPPNGFTNPVGLDDIKLGLAGGGPRK